MALYRQLQVAFWQDGFTLDLTPEEKFFYIYLMTNSKTKQCGIFELPKRIVEMETGYNRETVDKLLQRFVDYGKVLYCESTKEIMIVNWIKYNFINSRNTITCINKELKEVKNQQFILKFYELCSKFKYPLKEIFNEITVVQDKIMPLQGACKDLGEEEIKEEELIKEKEAEEVVEEETYCDIEASGKELKAVVQAFNNNIHPMTPMELEKIEDWNRDMKFDVIIMAIEEAVAHNARTGSYINSVLNNWHAAGLCTKAEVLSYKTQWNNKNKKEEKEFRAANADAYSYVE